MLYHAITCYIRCDNNGCKTMKKIPHFEPGKSRESVPANWQSISVFARTPTGRVKKRGGWTIRHFCTKCKKMGIDKMNEVGNQLEINAAQRKIAKRKKVA